MNQPFKIFVVDDDPIILEIIREMLEPACAVETFESAEACLTRIEVETPDMFLLDVSLPGMDGYTLCRKIKDEAALKQTPVTFVSALDSTDDRIKGYDAGGADFVVKPFAPDELLRKITVAKLLILDKRNLQEQAEASEQLSTLALDSMDEAGIVLQFMSKLIGWNKDHEIAEGLLELLKRYRLEGVVQTRSRYHTLTLSKEGANLPLETSVIEHISTMDRIFEFRSRSAHNFEHITLMVNNMPLNNPDFCGRLRDNLSIAAQGADARLLAIETEETNHRQQQGVLDALRGVRESITYMQQMHQQNRAMSTQLMLELDQSLANAFVHLGMSDNQERQMETLVDDFTKRLVELLDRSNEAQETLMTLGEKLGQLQR